MGIQIRGSQLRVGDTLHFLSSRHIVDRIEPYGRSNLPFIDETWMVAYSGRNFAMTIDPRGNLTVDRVEIGYRAN